MIFRPIEIVVTGLDPVIHLLRKKLSRRLMDARIKSGHDGCVLRGEVDVRFTHIRFKLLKQPTTVRCRAVIASEAKQSILPRKERKYGLLRFARNDV